MERSSVKIKGLLFVAIALFAFAPRASYASVEADPVVPTIIPRSTWGANESLMTWPEEYAPVQKFIVHHTASTSLVPDADGSGLYKSMVNAIYLFHEGKKSWTDGATSYTGFGDIGYNYLIDPNGNIYEGRAGGNGVVGGHATGFNEGSVGISIIGNYQDGAAGQTCTAVDGKVEKALARLIGWIAANNSLDLNRTSNFCNKSVDGVVGHRDVAATQCPGTVLYARLDGVQSQAVLYEQAYKKYVYQVRGSNAVYIFAGGYKTRFDSKSALPAAYQSYAVQYVSQSQLNAYRYKDRKFYPDGTLLQESGQSLVYYMQDNAKRPMSMTGAEFSRMGFKPEDIVGATASELDFFETGAAVKYGPDGRLIKDAKNNVYRVENGKKRAFTSAQLFEYLKYKWTDVKADAGVDSYLDGKPMVYPNGTPVRSKSSPSIYAMEDGTKRLFTSGALFERLGYKWTSVITIAESELGSFPSGANMIYPDGTLVRATGTPSVYLVSGKKKLTITSATLLAKLGYSFSSVVDIPAGSLADYPSEGKASYPDGTLIKERGAGAVYRVSRGGKEEFTSLTLFNAVGAKWSAIVEITPEEMALYATNGSVRYPDDTLFKTTGGSKIYVLKGGSPVWIQTAEEFLKAGYKWASVLTLDSAEFKLYVSETQTISNPDTNTDTNTNTNTDTDTNPDTDTGGTSAVVAGQEPKVRVAITSIGTDAESVKLTAGGAYKVEYHYADGTVYKTVNKAGGEITLVPFFDWDRYIRFLPSSDSVVMQVLSYSDSFATKTATYDDNQFRGVLELRYSPVSKRLWVIEEVQLEGYLQGISEATTRTNPQYLKAFAMITRSYVLYRINNSDKYPGEPFNVKNSRNGNGNDQQYKGYAFETRSPLTASSYKDTRGQVIVYRGKPIRAAYSSDSGGVTKDACTVWPTADCANDFPYLRGGVQDPAATTHNASAIAASHGVGLSAAGGYQMGVEGASWEKIITTYYPGVSIEKYY